MDPPSGASIASGGESKMISRPIVVAGFLLAVMPFSTLAQPSPKTKADLGPPPVQYVLASTQGKTNATISAIVDVRPETPLGPIDVLKGYENAMTAIANRISNELSGISQAVRMGQIIREEAEYLTQQRYQLAVMQYQVLSTLHDSLEHDVAQAAALSKPSGRKEDGSDTAVVIEGPVTIDGNQ
jgi:hypothetical protein